MFNVSLNGFAIQACMIDIINGVGDANPSGVSRLTSCFVLLFF